MPPNASYLVHCHVRKWPISEVARRRFEVRSEVVSGPELLGPSVSHSDPKPAFALKSLAFTTIYKVWACDGDRTANGEANALLRGLEKW
ncbi:hypothetical protein BRAS3843_270035 [Bradyrhizobium sp. STM 3843]|nr:hypothetical protein BRAS3843_270035 [Bradyrhizobium sp. STM 3843]